MEMTASVEELDMTTELNATACGTPAKHNLPQCI
jgi:hypothetical protein